MINTYTFPSLSAFAGIGHFVSQRRGGVSEGQFDSLNVSISVKDVREKVLENRRLLSEQAGFEFGRGVLPSLVHDNQVVVVGHKDAGRGWQNPDDLIAATDALITVEKELCLIVTLADCTPVLLYDPVQEVVGAVHAGWKGTIGLIAAETVQAMRQNYGSKPSDIRAGIGVSIGPCCYEVGEELAAQFVQEFGEEVVVRKAGKPYLDLWKSNRIALLRAGVLPQHIETAGICSACNTADYFSHRKEKGLTGRFCAGIWLKKS